MIIEDFVKNRQATVEELRDTIYAVQRIDAERKYWTSRYTLFLAELYFVDDKKDSCLTLLEHAITYFGLKKEYLEQRFAKFPKILSFVHSRYHHLYQKHEDGLDGRLIALYNDIGIIDQTWRKQEDTVRQHLEDEYRILSNTDSLVREVFLSLFRKGIYFTQSNIGKSVWSKFAYYLHLADTKDEDSWSEILSHFNKEVLAGSLKPEHLAMIIDRHALFVNRQKCRPMGSGYFAGGNPICNLEFVDKLRANIGLPSLGFVYTLKDKKLPAGYTCADE